MDFIKEYQGLIGSLIGTFFAVISSISLLYLKLNVDKKQEIKYGKNEIEKIFLMASRECDDSIKNLKMYITEVKKVLKKRNDTIDLLIPPRFNRIEVNTERIFPISKNLHHFISQQIDIAVSAAKKFNGWMDHYEELPRLIFEYNIKILNSGLTTKEKANHNYYIDIEKFITTIESNFIEIKKVQIHLLRPVFAQQHKDKELEMMMTSEKLDQTMDKGAEFFLNLLLKEK